MKLIKKLVILLAALGVLGGAYHLNKSGILLDAKKLARKDNNTKLEEIIDFVDDKLSIYGNTVDNLYNEAEKVLKK